MKKILVTGATGFIGSHLLRRLLRGGDTAQIVAMKRQNSRMELVADIADQVQWVNGDILDVSFLEDILRGGEIGKIFHTAAIVSFDPRDRKAMYQTNVEGTANIVNLAVDFEIEKLIYVSSVAAIGRPAKEPNISEKTKWSQSELNTHYAISKYKAEQEVWRGAAEGLNVAIVNPATVLGAQFWGQGTGRMFEQVWNGLRFYTQGITGFVDVRDVADFLVRLSESPITEERFILSGENLPYKTMFETIAKQLEKPMPNIKINPFLAGLAWRIEWLKSIFNNSRPLVTQETALASQHQYFYNAEKSLKVFPDFRYRSIAESIAETAQIFKKSKAQKNDFGFFKN